jgi:formylmethanofuran dehydrogenase subunit E
MDLRRKMTHELCQYLSRYMGMAIDDVSDLDPDLQELLLDYLRDTDGQGEVLDKNTAQHLRKVHPKKDNDGERCSSCGEWFPQAEPNQSDGDTFVCYLCRMYG